MLEWGSRHLLYKRKKQERHNNILFVNPGSIRLPRGPVQEKTYAIIESTPEQYLVQYYNKEHQPLERLKATFTK